MTAFPTAALTRRRIVDRALNASGLSLLPHATRAQAWLSRSTHLVSTKAEPMRNIFRMPGVEIDPVRTVTELQENFIIRAWPTFRRLPRKPSIEPK